MPGFDVQVMKAIPVDGIAEEVLVGDVEGILAGTDLDGDFPVAGRADQLGVGGVKDQRQRQAAELRIGQGEPEQGMGVEQQSHGRYSAQSLRCSSSSARMVSIPLQRPATGCGTSVGSPMSWATGQALRVMTNSS